MKRLNFLLILLLPLLATACSLTREEKHLTMETDEPKAVLTVDQRTSRIERQSKAEEDRCPPLPTLRDGATVFESRLHRQVIIALYKQCAESKK